MRHHRPERISDLIIEELNKIILKELEFPGALVTITDAAVTPKLDYAIIKFSVLPSEKSQEVLKILEKMQPHMQYLLIRKLNTRPVPKISFKIDLGLEKAAKVEKALLED